jgi:hypothetical protein
MLWSHDKQLPLPSQRGFDLIGMTAATLDDADMPVEAAMRLSARNRRVDDDVHSVALVVHAQQLA